MIKKQSKNSKVRALKLIEWNSRRLFSLPRSLLEARVYLALSSSLLDLKKLSDEQSCGSERERESIGNREISNYSYGGWEMGKVGPALYHGVRNSIINQEKNNKKWPSVSPYLLMWPLITWAHSLTHVHVSASLEMRSNSTYLGRPYGLKDQTKPKQN